MRPWLSSLAVAAGCGSDGYTPSCPPRPLYDVRVPAERTSAEVQRAEQEAIEAGCLTPRGEPVISNGGNPGEGGSVAGSATGGNDAEAAAGAGGANP